MFLSLEHVSNDTILLCDGQRVLAFVELIRPEVLVSPRLSERCFLVMPGPGRLSMSSNPGRSQIWLEVDGTPRAVVHLRSNNTFVCFYSHNMFSLQIV